MAKKPVLRCGNCLQFEHAKDRCSFLIPECKGPDRANHPFAQECANYTDQTGFAPLLDCDEDQLPAWYRQKELFDYEPEKAIAKDRDVKLKPQKRKRKQKPDQPEIMSLAMLKKALHDFPTS